MKRCPSPDCDSPPDEPPTYIHGDRIHIECPCGASGPQADSNAEALALWDDLPRNARELPSALLDQIEDLRNELAGCEDMLGVAAARADKAEEDRDPEALEPRVVP